MSVQEIERTLDKLDVDDLEALARMVTDRLGALARQGRSISAPEGAASIYDLVRDLPHEGEGSAVADLSASKEHLADFGRRSLG